MPLNIQIVRDGEPLKLRWGFWHLDCISSALRVEGKTLNDYDYVLTEEHEFTDETDGEVLKLLPGDRIQAWR